MTEQPVVAFSGVTKTFQRDGAPFTACSNLNFDVQAGEVVAIVGETGCGKSTALSLLLGLQEPSSGSVRVLGNDPFAQFQSLKGRVGIIFQNDRLLPWRSALDNVAFGLEILHVPKAERLEKARFWLDRVGLSRFMNSHPHQLSGGMRQRVSIARTFALNPPLLLADEAFSALDEITAAALRSDLLSLIGEEKKTTIFITHSVTEAAELAERILVFGKPGRVVSEIKAKDMLTRGQSRADIAAEIRDGLKSARSPQSYSMAS
ncbi:ABC transporter ATP-binding protein [Bradyrhizobium sp. SYSU BS000235]|uniref:ABC transporter ATP-binding protein n=1 Tax=Bradyrhizobium sp. SYSU BS000235 TaxID=3411332 RepID=UPI003C76AA26